MPNTNAENVLVQRAMQLVRLSYGEFLPTGKMYQEWLDAVLYKGRVEEFVKFLDAQEFRDKLLKMGDKPKLGCSTIGFTTWKSFMRNQKVSLINRGLANPTTIVHELLHVFTHPDFTKSVPLPLDEAITEYFTRKVVTRAEQLPSKKKGDYAGFDKAGRKGRYDDNHEFLLMGRKAVKESVSKEERKDYMKRAYFQGDPKAIALVTEYLNDLAAAFTD